MNLLQEAENLNMSELQLNAVLGSLLGDASLSKSSPMTNAIRWNHSSKQMDYVQYKYQTLQEFATREPQLKTNPGYGEYWAVLALKASTIFHSMYVLTHPNNCQQKTVTKAFLNQITHPIALAWWFMDDGSRQKASNTGTISTNGFTEQEVQLLSDWLRLKWHLATTIRQVKHSSTGNIGYILYLPVNTYIRWMEMIQPYVPECMQYKTMIFTQQCACCGTEIPISHKVCCSPACAHEYNKAVKAAYATANKEHLALKSKEWKELHRDQINAAARERYKNMTPEQKQALNEYSRMYRSRNSEEYNAHRRAYRQAKKSDPAYMEKLRLERQRYYQRLKEDPIRYEKRLQRGRDYRHTEEGRAKGREYLRKHRAEKRAQDPEALAAYEERKAHMEMLSNMTPEERAEYDKEYARNQYHRRMEELEQDPEALAAHKEKQHQRSAERWANMSEEEKQKNRDYAKKRRASMSPEEKAEKAAQKKAWYEKNIAIVKADPVLYAEYKQTGNFSVKRIKERLAELEALSKTQS